MKSFVRNASILTIASLAFAAGLHLVSRDYAFEPTPPGMEVQAAPGAAPSSVPLDPSANPELAQKISGNVRTSGSLDQGDILVQAIFMNPVQEEIPEDRLVFQIAFETQSYDLEGLDLTRKAMLRNSKGVTISTGYDWQLVHKHGVHHLVGFLVAPHSENGVGLTGGSSEWIELTISGIPKEEHRTFRWSI